MHEKVEHNQKQIKPHTNSAMPFYRINIATCYENIFKKMKEIDKRYEQVEERFNLAGKNIERLIGELKKGINEEENFLKEKTEATIHSDFMKATQEIVKGNVNKAYKCKRLKLFLLFEKFSNYLTLNFDPFLYLLLMKFKKKENGNKNSSQGVLFPVSGEASDEAIKTKNEKCHEEISKAYEQGCISLTVEGRVLHKKLSELPKTKLQSILKIFFAEEYKVKDIESVIGVILGKKQEKELEGETVDLFPVNDAFFKEKKMCKFVSDINQNVFFLHGAFHIYTENGTTYKLTQTEDQALYENLQKINDDSSKKIVCVLTDTSDGKKKEIEENDYLRGNFNKLKALCGSVVIIGCSLSDNDNHIFSEINNNQNIDTIYYASCEEGKKQDEENAHKHFSKKEVILFDRETSDYTMN